MMAAQEIFDLLAAPFPVEEISWRVGPTNERSRREDQPLRGQPLCYIDARSAMDRLDSVVGPAGWQCSYTPGVGTSIVCNLGVCIGAEWIWKADGAGPSDMEADKGALSDAFKRAAVRWGIARYLYDLKAPWIVLEKRGNSAFIPDSALVDLNALHDNLAKKYGWGEQSGVAAYRLLLADVASLQGARVDAFLKQHDKLIEGLPPAMRKHFLKQIEARRAAA
jgi:hypothetical protein